jgi:hypothetical protein
MRSLFVFVETKFWRGECRGGAWEMRSPRETSRLLFAGLHNRSQRGSTMIFKPSRPGVHFVHAKVMLAVPRTSFLPKSKMISHHK